MPHKSFRQLVHPAPYCLYWERISWGFQTWSLALPVLPWDVVESSFCKSAPLMLNSHLPTSFRTSVWGSQEPGCLSLIGPVAAHKSLGLTPRHTKDTRNAMSCCRGWVGLFRELQELRHKACRQLFLHLHISCLGEGLLAWNASSCSPVTSFCLFLFCLLMPFPPPPESHF